MKAALRRTIKERLAKLGQSELLAQSQRLLAKLTALPQYQNAQTIALYMSMDNSEIKTDLLVRDALDRGKRVYLPRITHLSKFQDYQRHEKQKSCLHFLEVELNDLEQMKPQGKYQLREPAFKFARGKVVNDLLLSNTRLDLMVMPGLAFTPNCDRLGHGVGFYDDFIKRYHEKYSEKPYLLGIGLAEQLEQTLPLEAHDEKLDCVILGDGQCFP
ncbi:hypothetical protein KL935_004584 [Ogataea polymorpha]|uniref:5-formyltetrahydrofolate cyclo-ligase n=1 Tax=Ogataea polymorpha TaxID=460523 RepID=A0A1B7SHR5_9ASCO|nr:uncharacterized protein OGAPODRAFT_88534 [Ogataea polymorpha]KAG7891310.1 hypothetical protein KL908_004063 [Ogataea polymorpha]KAG7898031.1 hypothetical protein KL935_004584 [Ogataea polymorpha]KAG7906197.1 hypothetical protein KL906_004650 [Ogataea polymorpha]KAG7914132.1 hypothetical protein KL927_004783 [Ogataea polymorpha]KAG7930580.1 hypothetical protein KL934_004653 [Ogataea polymorpha]